MSKAVLISIRPEWCELIANGEKTVEVRKTRPKIGTPFKCYIYCTAGNLSYPVKNGMVCHNAGGKAVIGEFVCDSVTYLGNVATDSWRLLQGDTHEHLKQLVTKQACLTEEQLHEYGGREAWHISKLLIYDTPKGLGEFAKPDKCPYHGHDGCTYPYHCFRAGQLKRCGDWMEKPPQSWCYVQELQEGGQGDA